ncbi:MAG: glycosyltransferase [Clostridia bacterium]|nr:glycosyltransferase [Clostridia bacterium]
MKIAIINTWSISNKAIGGTERFVMDLANSLIKEKNEVDVYMFSGKTHKENGVNYINIDLFNTDEEADEYIVQNYFGNFESEKSYINLAEKLQQKINIDKYDFIQLNSQLFLECWKNKKRIFTIHTNPFEYELAWGKESYSKMLEIMKKYKNSKNTFFVAPSKYYANEYKKLTDCDIKVIPHAIDIERLKTEKTKEEINLQYGLDYDKLKIVVPQRLEPQQKQPMLLLKACCLLKEEDKKRIQIIYTGLDKQYIKFVDTLKETAKDNNIDIKIIRFDYMSEAYKIADFTVLPSKSESFGYSALESLILGIPTILNDIPTFNEIAEDNENNYIFKKSDVENLKEKIYMIINNNKYLERKIPPNDWKNKYKLNEFVKSYLSLI